MTVMSRERAFALAWAPLFGLAAALSLGLAQAATAADSPGATGRAYAAALKAGFDAAAATHPQTGESSPAPAAKAQAPDRSAPHASLRDMVPPKPSDTLWPWQS